jgi:hypothetical protein
MLSSLRLNAWSVLKWRDPQNVVTHRYTYRRLQNSALLTDIGIQHQGMYSAFWVPQCTEHIAFWE